MGVPINRVFSSVQDNIGDLSMDRVQIGHYVELCNRIASNIAIETQVYIGRYIATPVNDQYAWDKSFRYTKGMIADDGGTMYISIENNANSQPSLNAGDWSVCPEWVAGTYNPNQYVRHGNTIYKAVGITNSEPPSNNWKAIGIVELLTNQVILPFKIQQELIAPYKLISVSRYDGKSFTETTEYSTQAVRNTQNANYSFSINRTVLNQSSFATDFINKMGSVEGDMRLNFTASFNLDERVFIDYITHTPFLLTDWNQSPPVMIPEFLQESFHFGLLWLVSEMLFNRGDQAMGNVANRAEQQYNKVLRAAVGYTRMLRNNQSTLQMRPVNWLSED